MDSSRRAVESYWRSRMIDAATSDDDKVAAVYKLEEICELLRSSHVSIVKEIAEFIFKRLENKSPIVKHKALRVIKYAVAKSGSEFRREMQRNSAAIRQLIHYKGQPDPLKGDALNKAVREIAQEVLSAIFSSEDNSKPTTAESLTKRIQGFGNTNFETHSPSEDKKSFLSEVVGIGSATIKHGLSSLSQSQSMRKNDTGTYKSPNLRRSLTRETNASDSYDQTEYHGESHTAPRFSESTNSRSWGQDVGKNSPETSNGVNHPSPVEKSREERLLETIVTSGGVRLQPTRDALQVFLLEASKLDALALCRALLSKLQSPLWQVRMKAVCVAEAILRKKDDDLAVIAASYLEDNRDVIVACSESPQASLREKANKVLSLLGGEQSSNGLYHQEKKVENSAIQMPDLIDTGALDDYSGTEDLLNVEINDFHEKISTAPVLDDLFGESTDSSYLTSNEQKTNSDPFSDVAFHTNDNTETVGGGDIFEGMSVDKNGVEKVQLASVTAKDDPFDIFGSSSDYSYSQFNDYSDASDLMNGLSVNGNNTQKIQQQVTTSVANLQSNNQVLPENGGISQSGTANANMFNMGGPMGYNMPPGLMFNPAFAASQQMNYGAMGNILAQQQLLATMYNFQQFGNLQPQNSGFGQVSEGNMGGVGGSNSSALPDIFNPNIPNQTPTSMMNNSKKEETTKAFDFISDHLASARDPKRVV
ncbi:protein MODIFIED TRANSPORT TO THE VACUOLE 1 [Impatiens glandulifera]|uniref:protein MODIFIED TRANSPORT TO THE VACUOLE 1 n=1 Tax=Impatiens glandulifera TaxID=253017 RepID=UPI001FB0C706|nr:protein MODIFIED TRANSPORT TO THE VACUOLE 1 [Impatiens glandulifera]